ncbi:MAG: ABC transporter ATP-binding protein [Frankiaceae bacterium]
MDPGSMMGWRTMRSFSRDSSVASQRLAPGTVGRVWGFAAPYRRDLAIFLVTVVLDALVTVATPLLFRSLIDTAIPQRRLGLVWGIAGIVAGLAFFDSLLAIVQRWFSSRIGEGLIFDLRSRVYDHVQRMPIAFFTRTQTGALVSRLNNDVIGAQQAFTSTLSGVLSNVIALIATVAVMLRLSWQITVIALVLLPVFILPARRFGYRLREITREGYQLNASMNTTMTERFNVSGALLVKLFGRPDAEAKSFSDRAGRVRDIGIVSAMYSRAFFVALTLVASLATAVVYGMGGWLSIQRGLSIGTIVALSALLTRLYGPLTALSNVRVDVMTALVSFERVFEVLDLPPMIAERSDAVVLPADARTVELDHVEFSYPTAAEVSLASLEDVAVLDSAPSQQVLHDVSFRVEPGQLVALVGPSGAGKTTITQLPTRMYDVQGGSVRVGGHDVRDVTLESLRRVIGVVTQDAHLFHDTIRNNLLYAKPEATDAELVEALRAAQIWSLVSSLPDGVDTVVGDRGYRLSGGEKQRIAIARLLLKAPAIVVLDEATAHLDSESEVAVQRALATALTDRTSIVIAHRLSTVRHADQILVIDGGRVVERGRHEELLRRGGLYAELYRTQFERQAVTEAAEIAKAGVATMPPESDDGLHDEAAAVV